MKSISELSSISANELNSMSKKDLSRVVSRLSSAANKRLKRFENKGNITPATISAEKSGGKFRAKGKTLNELRSEYIRVRNFLNLKTSTVRGYSKFKSDFFDRVEAKSGIRVYMTDEKLSRFWRIYDKTANLSPFFKGSDQRQKMVFDMFIDMETKSDEEILKDIQGKFNNWYEEQQAIENEYDTSTFFEIS